MPASRGGEEGRCTANADEPTTASATGGAANASSSAHSLASLGVRVEVSNYSDPNGGRGGPADLPTQGTSVSGAGAAVAEQDNLDGPSSSPSDLEYLQELLAIQNTEPKSIGFFGTRNMGYLHQQLVEILSYAMVLTGNHIYTSGATGTNAAVIRGALRAERPELLTVVLPQSMSKQPAETQEQLQKVTQVIEMPQNDHLTLLDASRICNQDIVGRVVQLICFVFHDSNLLLETCREAKSIRKIVCLFYLD